MATSVAFNSFPTKPHSSVTWSGSNFRFQPRCRTQSPDSPGNLVPQPFRGNEGDFIDNSLVGVKVKCQPRVELLDDDSRSSLHRFGSDTTLEFKIRATK